MQSCDPREAVLESPGVRALRAYVLHKFNEARSWYNQWLAEVDATTRVSSRIAQTSTSLSRRPLFNAIRDAIESGKSNLFLTRVPTDLGKAEGQVLLAELENEIDSPDLFISDVQFDALGPQFGIALFDVKSRCIRVNTLHPFFANYAEHYKNPEPFVLLAATEVLTEGFLHEQQVNPVAARVILEKRDRFLRELVYSRPLAAPVVAQMLEESVSTPGEFEEAVYRGFLTLNFDVTKIGGKGEPDGVGNALLGIRNGIDASYTFTYDAKSTSALRVKAHTVGTGTITRHRDKYKADYAIVVAPDFEGGDSADAAIIYEAKSAHITLMPVVEFSRLILLASTRQFGLAKLRDLLDSCHTPAEVRDWINKRLAEEAPEWPLPEILRTINELQKEGVEVVRFGAIRVQSPKLRKYKEREIEGWISSAAMLAGGYINVVGDIVTLDAPPEKILSEIRRASDNLPAQFRPEAMIDQLAKTKSTEKKLKKWVTSRPLAANKG